MSKHYPHPLYNNDDSHTSIVEQNPNLGLKFNRFFGYKKKWLKPESSEKSKFLDKFNKSCGDKNQLKQATLRQLALIDHLKGQNCIFKLDWHLVTGMGNPHPVENGLLWHHSYGVPYLSGSQIKGMLRSYFENYYQAVDKEQVLHRLFGSDHKDEKVQKKAPQIGELIFFDALPVKPVSLVTDIMTPHYGDWYQHGGSIKDVKKEHNKVPADWHDPIPISFLAVKQASFLISIASRTSKTYEQLQQIMKFIEDALAQEGIGAKTQTGYGYLLSDQKELTVLTDSYQTIKQERNQIQTRQTNLANAQSKEMKAYLDLKQDSKKGWDDFFEDSVKKDNFFQHQKKIKELLETMVKSKPEQAVIALLDSDLRHFLHKDVINNKVKKGKKDQIELWSCFLSLKNSINT